MEFFAAGKVVVTNNVTADEDRPDERAHNHALPAQFRSLLADLASENDSPRSRARRNFARDNTYAREVDRIAAVLADLRPRSSLETLS